MKDRGFDVYHAIQTERENQRAEGYTEAHDDAHPLTTWVALLARHAGLAMDDGGCVSVERFRRQMIRVAAVAVAAAEALDRQQARRKGGAS